MSELGTASSLHHLFGGRGKGPALRRELCKAGGHSLHFIKEQWFWTCHSKLGKPVRPQNLLWLLLTLSISPKPAVPTS